MSAAGVLLALLAALLVGYAYGRRAAAGTRPTWRQRTSRAALGRRAASLAVLTACAEVQRHAERRLAVRRRAPRRRRAASFRRW